MNRRERRLAARNGHSGDPDAAFLDAMLNDRFAQFAKDYPTIPPDQVEKLSKVLRSMWVTGLIAGLDFAVIAPDKVAAMRAAAQRVPR